MAPKLVDKVYKRAEILQAAVRVIAAKGFQFTKMADIAVEAGIGKGTIYEYFRSKNELLRAAFAVYMEACQEQTRAILASELTPLKKLRQIILAPFQDMAENSEMVRVILDFWVEAIYNHEQPDIEFRSFYKEYRELAAALLTEAKQAGEVRADIPGDTPAVLLGAIEGVFVQYIVDPGAIPLDKIAGAIVETFFHGIARK